MSELQAVWWVLGSGGGLVFAALGGLARLVLRSRQELTDYKLQVAKEYASTDYLKDVDRRLNERLKSIEGKLDDMIRGYRTEGR